MSGLVGLNVSLSLEGFSSILSQDKKSISIDTAELAVFSENLVCEDIFLSNCLGTMEVLEARDVTASSCSTIRISANIRDLELTLSRAIIKVSATKLTASGSVVEAKSSDISEVTLDSSLLSGKTCAFVNLYVLAGSAAELVESQVDNAFNDGNIVIEESTVVNISGVGTLQAARSSVQGGLFDGEAYLVDVPGGAVYSGSVLAVNSYTDLSESGSAISVGGAGASGGSQILIRKTQISALNGTIAITPDNVDSTDAVVVAGSPSTSITGTNVLSVKGVVQGSYVVGADAQITATAAIGTGPEPTASSFINVQPGKAEINVLGLTRIYGDVGTLVKMSADVTEFIANTVYVPLF